MLESEKNRQIATQTSRNPNQLVIFKTCITCEKSYEYIEMFFQFETDTECIYCANGDPLPYNFKKLDFVTSEDAEIPKQIEDCFQNIDISIEDQMVVETTSEEIPSRKKKKTYKKPTKDKKD